MNTNCDRWRDAILERAAGDLDLDGTARLDRHLAACPACRAESATWSLLADEARAASRLPAPPLAGAMSKVLAASATTDKRHPSGPATIFRPRRPSWSSLAWAPRLLVLAACAAVFLGLATWLRPVRISNLPADGSGRSTAQTSSDADSARRSTRTRPLSSVPDDHRQEPHGAEPLIHRASTAIRLARGLTDSPGSRSEGKGRSVQSSPAQAIVAFAPSPSTIRDLALPAVASPRPPVPAEEEALPDRRTATPEPALPMPSPYTTIVPAPDLPSTRPPWPPLPPARPGMARIAGKVEDPSGRPVVMALVYLRPADDGQHWGVVLTDTDHLGGFAVVLPPGRWELWVEAEGLQPLRYQEEPVLDLQAQQERTGILMRVSPPEPTSTPPTGAPPTPIAPLDPIAVAPILPTVTPTEDAPSR